LSGGISIEGVGGGGREVRARMEVGGEVRGAAEPRKSLVCRHVIWNSKFKILFREEREKLVTSHSETEG
jgi:hypothetical protein